MVGISGEGRGDGTAGRGRGGHTVDDERPGVLAGRGEGDGRHQQARPRGTGSVIYMQSVGRDGGLRQVGDPAEFSPACVQRRGPPLRLRPSAGDGSKGGVSSRRGAPRLFVSVDVARPAVENGGRSNASNETQGGTTAVRRRTARSGVTGAMPVGLAVLAARRRRGGRRRAMRRRRRGIRPPALRRHTVWNQSWRRRMRMRAPLGREKRPRDGRADISRASLLAPKPKWALQKACSLPSHEMQLGPPRRLGALPRTLRTQGVFGEIPSRSGYNSRG